jgi:hypothetical protein
MQGRRQSRTARPGRGLRCAVDVRARLPISRHDPSVMGKRASQRSRPSSDARVSGKPRESIFGDPPAVAPSPSRNGQMPSRDRQHDRTAIRLRSVRPVARTIALRSYRNNQRSGVGRALTVACTSGGELELRACLHAKASAAGIRMRRFTIVSCRLSSFQWQESFGFPRRACPRLI